MAAVREYRAVGFLGDQGCSKPLGDFGNFYTGHPKPQPLPDAARTCYRIAQDLNVFPSLIRQARRLYDDVYICELIYLALNNPKIKNKGAYISTVLKKVNFSCNI